MSQLGRPSSIADRHGQEEAKTQKSHAEHCIEPLSLAPVAPTHVCWLFLGYHNRIREHPHQPCFSAIPCLGKVAQHLVHLRASRLGIALCTFSFFLPSTIQQALWSLQCKYFLNLFLSTFTASIPVQAIVITQLISFEGFLTRLLIFAIFILLFFVLIGRSRIFNSSFGFLKQLY